MDYNSDPSDPNNYLVLADATVTIHLPDGRRVVITNKDRDSAVTRIEEPNGNYVTITTAPVSATNSSPIDTITDEWGRTITVTHERVEEPVREIVVYKGPSGAELTTTAYWTAFPVEYPTHRSIHAVTTREVK